MVSVTMPRACVLALVALSWSACVAAGGEDENAFESQSVPLPLLLDSIRSELLDLPDSQHSRAARGAFGQGVQGLQGSEGPVPWYSRATRGEDDSAAREELQVIKVSREENVNYGSGVRKWHSLVVGSTTYLVGLGSSGLTVVTYRFVTPDVGSGQTYSYSEKHIPTGGTPLAAALFKHWNAATKALEAILVFSVKGDPNLMWYRLTDRGEEAIRSWPVHKTVTFLKVFQVGEQMKLVMLTSCESKLELVPCDYAAVFEFSVGAPLDAKLSQTLTLEGEAVSAEIGAVGDEVFLALALPEPGVVKLFRYHWPPLSDVEGTGNYSTHGWFEFWRDLPSPAVTHAIFFHVSYKMYLAVGGAKPAVFRFVSSTRLEGCPKALQQIGFVSTWLVLPVQTYRDEVILLAEVEHSVNSAPFKGVVTLTWASVGVFNWQYQPPCYVGGVKSTVEGVSCIIAESSELGLRGAVAVQLGDATVVRVLVPGGARPSSMYSIYTQLQPVVNPLLAEILMLREAQAVLKAEIAVQDFEMEETERLLLDTLNARGQNVINADWIIEEVETDEHDHNGTWPPTQPSIEDQIVDLGALEERLTELTHLTDQLSSSLSDAAVPLNGELHLLGTQTILGGLEIKGKSSFDSLAASSLNGEPVPVLIKDVVRLDRLEKIGGTKSLQKLLVSEIQFSMINNIPKYDLIFNMPNQTIQVNGNLEFTDLLHVHGDIDIPSGGTFGGIDLSEEVLVPGREFKGTVYFDEVKVEGDLNVNVINTVVMSPNNLRSIASGVTSFGENVTYDSLLVNGQLQVERVNGFLWSDIVKRIVWKDAPDNIEGFTSIAGVLKSSAMELQQLNSLDFPNDFVLKTTSDQHITGRKVFENQLLVGSVDVTNAIDSIPVNRFVTLTTDQNLDGSLKLQEADISGNVKVEWAVNGVRMNQMHGKSPLVGPGTVVSSNVAFSHLEVVGPIQIASTLNERNFKNDLLDILVLPSTRAEPVHISGKKVIWGNLEVGGNGVTVGLINDKKISDIVRLDVDQKFLGEKTITKAVFDNLHLKGLWDRVNVEDLNADAVRLTGVQDTTTQLTFVHPAKLAASRLMISEQINTVMASTVLTGSSNVCDPVSVPDVECVIKGPVRADIFRVQGNVVVNGKVCGWNLVDFEKRRVSRSRPQAIVGDFSFDVLNITSHIRVSTMNSQPVATLGSTDSVLKAGFDLESGDFAVDELYIDGNIHTSLGVNYLNLTLISQNAVKLHASNKFLGSLVFEDILNVGTLDVRGPINRLNLAFLIEDAVLKNENSITISGRKTFDKGFIVDGDIRTANLNGLDPSKIITKFSPATVAGPLRVLGSVYAGNVNLTGFFNGIPVSSFQNRYQLLSEGRHLLRGNSHFLAGVSVDDLFVMYSVNGTKLEDFFASVVMKDESARITGTKHFINRVVFLDVDVKGLVNNLSLSELAMDVVLHNDDKPVTVNGRVTFSNSLTTRSGVSLSENLHAQELDGCLIKEWLDNAIYLASPMQIYGVKKFSLMSSSSDLRLSMLNAVDLTKVITLNRPQDIPGNVNIIAAALRHNLRVDGKVNGRHLQPEYDNTLLVTGNQVVTGPKAFVSGLSVQNNVQMNGLISGRDITNVVTLLGDEIVTGPLRFSNMVIDGNLRAGLISSIDVQKWQERAFLRNSPVQQVVTGAWDVKGQVKLMDSARGGGLLDGEDVHALADSVSKAREETRRMQKEVKVDWIQLCHDTDALLQKARAQPFLFQQIESVQAIQASQTIASMHAFEALNEQFLAVSYSSNCSGAMYHWNRHRTAWELLDGAVQNIGSVERWVTVRNAGSTYLVTSAASEISCPYQGGNIWRFEPAKTPLQLRNVQTVDAWHDAEVDEEAGRLHLLGRSGVDIWHLEDGAATKVRSVSLPETDNAQFVPRSAGLGLSISDGKSLTQIEQGGDNTTQGVVSRSANSNLPARSQGNLVTMKIADGRKLVAVSAEASNLLVVYEDVATGRSLATVQVNGAHSLSVLELTTPGRNGQTLLAFIENETLLRVVQYKGVEGFVDVTTAKLAVSVKEMIPVRLHARVFVNPRHFLLLRSDRQILSLEVEMTGDPLDEPALNCNLP